MLKSLTTSALSLAALAAVLSLLQEAPALAGPGAVGAKTWVSHNGNDANNCLTPAQACLTFSGALSATAPGGEIGVVDANDYATASITFSVSITSDGAGVATINLFGPFDSGPGLLISAGAGAVVSLRGLVIHAYAGGDTGIHITSASAVHIQNCVIRNFQAAGRGYGIAFQPLGNTQLFVTDTLIYNNGTVAGTAGIYIGPTDTGSANVVLDRVHLENNVIGLWVDGFHGNPNGAHVIVRDSVISGNAGDGIQARSMPGAAPVFVLVEHTSSVNNGGIGIHADGPHATILLKDNTITRNGIGINAVNSGQLISYGNNTNNNNLGSEGAPTGFFSQM